MARHARLSSQMSKETTNSKVLGRFTACQYVCSVMSVVCAMAAAVLWYSGYVEMEQESQWPWFTRLVSSIPSLSHSHNNDQTGKEHIIKWFQDTGKIASETIQSFKDTLREETDSISEKSISTLLLSFVWSIILIGGAMFTCYWFCRRKRSTEQSSSANQQQKIEEFQLRGSSVRPSQAELYYLDHHLVWCTRLRTLVFMLIFLAVAVSIPWEFIRLYQHEISKKAAITIAGAPVECFPDQMSLWQTLSSWLRWHFSWAEDPCEKYHKAVLVDPVWEVTPMMVLSSVLARCITQPLETFFGGVGLAMRALFTSIPSPWQPVVMALVVLTVLTLTIMSCGYQISVPFFLNLKPHKQTNETLSVPHAHNLALKRGVRGQTAIEGAY